MAKNLSTNTQRTLGEYSTKKNSHFFSYFLVLWTCFRKKLKLKLKILCRRLLDEEKFFAGEEKFFVEYSSSIRRLFVGKFFAMFRWALF